MTSEKKGRLQVMEEATALMMDKALFGFAAIGPDGRRVDAYELLPAEHKRVIAPYREDPMLRRILRTGGKTA